MFFDDSSERMRIDSSGRVNIGGAAVSQTRNLNIGSDSEANLAIETHNDATSETANIRFYKSGNTGASPQVVETDDNIAQIQAYGYDGTDYACAAASIKFEVDGAPGSNDMPGKITFSTTADGATSPSDSLRIDSGGNITKHRNAYASVYLSAGNQGSSSSRVGDGYIIPGNYRSNENIGSHYSTTTGKFTCPIDGIYAVGFSTNITLSNLSVGDQYNVRTFVNGSLKRYNYGICHRADWELVTFTNYVKCSANDYIQIGFNAAANKTIGADVGSQWNEITFILVQ